MNRTLRSIESIGNKIPHPSLLFFWLCLLICALSVLGHLVDFKTVHPVTREVIDTQNLLGSEGLRFILTTLVGNFTGFAPVGVVLVAMLGLGIAEKSGVLNFFLLKLVTLTQGKWLTFFVSFTGIMSSIATDSGYVILIPLSALMFKAAGRTAIEGIATAFAAVSAGFGANLLIGPFDAVLAGISTEAANILQKDREVAVTSNWIFSIFSTFLIACIITVITSARRWDILATGESATATIDTAKQAPEQKSKGLLIYTLIFFITLLLLVAPAGAPLRNPETQGITDSPFIRGIVVFVSLYFAGLGMVFGFTNKVFKQSTDIIVAMESSLKSLAGYLVLMFFAAQFVAWFNWSNLGLILSVKGAGLLANTEPPAFLLLVLFILITGLVNLFIGSGSAKWALLAPVFIPMLMLLNVPPETAQMAYRIGDSSTNILSPMMPYFALALSFLQRYQPSAGFGTLLAAMIPYSLGILGFWTFAFLAWLWLGLPLGV